MPTAPNPTPIQRLAFVFQWEHTFPGLIAVPFGLMTVFLPTDARLQMIIDVAPQLLVVLSVMVGFTATAMTILFTAPDVKAIEILKTSKGQFNRLVGYHHSAIVIGLLAGVLSLVMLISCRAMSPSALGGPFGEVIVGEWWFTCVWAMLTFYRALGLLTRLLTTNIDVED